MQYSYKHFIRFSMISFLFYVLGLTLPIYLGCSLLNNTFEIMKWGTYSKTGFIIWVWVCLYNLYKPLYEFLTSYIKAKQEEEKSSKSIIYKQTGEETENEKMRTIKFRGFSNCLFQNKWVYGYLSDEDKIRGIDLLDCRVNYKSVGQFTGLYDKNGKEIYEGDILAHDNGDYSLIVYREECMAFCRIDANDVGNTNGYYNLHEEAWRLCLKHAKVVGNQYENPELLNYSEN
nr:MAG TPA: YopX protein [Caudoviricetes sp.]